MNRSRMVGLKTEEIKELILKNEEVVSVLLLLTITSIHLPYKILSPLFFLLCPLLYLFKNELLAKKEFRFLFYFFCIYLLLFTLFSQNIMKSLVADFKVMKGIFFFSFAGLFFLFMKEIKSVLPHSIILFLLVNSSFLFINEHIVPNKIYFSYYNHPNTAGFSLFFFVILAIFLWALSKTTAEKTLNFATVLSGIVLIVISNSRSIWLGAIVFTLALVFLAKAISARLKFALLLFLIFCGALLFLYFDSKNPLESMAIRSVIWTTMYDKTVTHHPLVGFGFNTYKDFFQEIRSLGNMPHNSIMEIFQSSGFLGTGMFAVIMSYMLLTIYKIYKIQITRERSSVVIISCSALIAFFVISLFDFRFFDYKFMATAMVFVGLQNAVAVESDAM